MVWKVCRRIFLGCRWPRLSAPVACAVLCFPPPDPAGGALCGFAARFPSAGCRTLWANSGWCPCRRPVLPPLSPFHLAVSITLMKRALASAPLSRQHSTQNSIGVSFKSNTWFGTLKYFMCTSFSWLDIQNAPILCESFDLHFSVRCKALIPFSFRFLWNIKSYAQKGSRLDKKQTQSIINQHSCFNNRNVKFV